MPIRSGMQPLVDRLRKAVGDTGSPATFTDNDLQDALDDRGVQVGAALLAGDHVLSGSPTVFRAPFGFWEAGAVLASSSGAVSPTASDPMNGVWTFTTAPGTALYVTGHAFDFWGSAANLLEERAARAAVEFDFGTDQQTFNRSDKRKGFLAVAKEYGRRALPSRSRGTTW